MKISDIMKEISANKENIAATKEESLPSLPLIISILPFLSSIAAVVPSIINQTAGINTVRAGIIILLLTSAVTFYIRINADIILGKKLAKTIITSSYLVSICLLLFVPDSGVLCFWMIGGLLVSMLIDRKLGLLLHINISFLMGILVAKSPDLIIQVLILGAVMCLLSSALAHKSTVIYGAIIILSLDITLSFLMNNLLFNSEAGFNYFISLVSVLAVIVVAYLLNLLYGMLSRKQHQTLSKCGEVVQHLAATKDENVSKNDSMSESREIREPLDTVQATEDKAATDSTQGTKAIDTASAASSKDGVDTVKKVSSISALTEGNDEIVADTSITASVDSVKEALTESSKEAVMPTQSFEDKATEANVTSQTMESEKSLSSKNQRNETSKGLSEESKPYEFQNTWTSYDVLCDQNNELLQKMKETSESLFTHSIYIGDLSYRAALTIGANANLAMAGGLYHEVGRLKGKNYIEEGLKIAEEYSFPKELKAILKQHNINSEKPASVEAAIVMLSDSVVSTIDYIEKNNDRRFTTDKIIDSIFHNRMEKGSFDSSSLTLRDYKLLKEFFQKEFENKDKQ